MKRMTFNKDGTLNSIDGNLLDIWSEENGNSSDSDTESKLLTSQDLDFLKEQSMSGTPESPYWSLHESGQNLKPLVYTNGKTQADIVKEVVDLIKSGEKIIFIHGVCGTGKCLDKDSLILCKPNENKSFSYHKISEIAGKEGEILSLDSKGCIIKSAFNNVRETGQKKLFKLKTNTGREIIVSENHPFLTITSKGISWVPLSQLNSQSYVCLPNHISIESLEGSLDNSKLKILGHLISEGGLGDKAGSPKYCQDRTITPLIRQDYVQALQKTFSEGIIRDNHQTEVTIVFNNKDTRFGTTNKLKLFIREFGLDGTRSRDKFLPEIIFNLSEEKIAVFLQALFSGDGCIYTKKNRENEQIIIEYDSISKRLIQDISILLSRFGIQHTITSHKFRENLDYSWRISISNQENVRRFIEKIGFLGEKQALALSILARCKTHKFTNLDKVPRIIREYLKNKGYAFNELDRMLNYEAIEKLRQNIGFKKIIKNKLTGTPCVFKQGEIDFLRTHLRKINEYIKDDVLSFICNEQIFWDKIKSIEFLKEDITYDLEVPEQHNFIANGIIVHNSAIALNISRILGKSSIVVPIKSLQKQYEEDYTKKKYLLKPGGKKMKIALITGRDNHDSIIEPGVSCAGPMLPDTILITEKNKYKLFEYYKENPFIQNKTVQDIKRLKRISIAPANPYWSPILPEEFELNHLSDAHKKRYKAVQGRGYIFYHRKQGCSYYDQFQAYLDADVIIFNSAKYELEMALGRKPESEVDIIDEADAFLDNFSKECSLDLVHLQNSLQHILPDNDYAESALEKLKILLDNELKQKGALGVGENIIFPLKDTFIGKIISLLLESTALQAEIYLDDSNYANKALETAMMFEDTISDTYVTYKRFENALFANIVTTNVSKKFQDLVSKTKALVLMSGTLHSPDVLKNVFGIKDYSVVEAETKTPGTITIFRSGQELNCEYKNLSLGKDKRKQYLLALSECMKKAKKPILVHVNAFEDLPSESELSEYNLQNLISKETLKALQHEDKHGERINKFKSKIIDTLFTTKCSRGADFPGDTCNSVVFTKYPNPNTQDIFWKILKLTHPKYFWSLYTDKAKREFLQRLYRALRSQDDHVILLSPDTRVLDAARFL